MEAAGTIQWWTAPAMEASIFRTINLGPIIRELQIAKSSFYVRIVRGRTLKWIYISIGCS